MNVKDLEDELNDAFLSLGLDGWEAFWCPDPSEKVNGRVLSEQKIIIVFSEDPKKARDVFLHEVIEVKLRKLIGNYIKTVNGMIEIIQDLNHAEKERTIDELVPLIRHVFEDKEEG